MKIDLVIKIIKVSYLHINHISWFYINEMLLKLKIFEIFNFPKTVNFSGRMFFGFRFSLRLDFQLEILFSDVLPDLICDECSSLYFSKFLDRPMLKKLEKYKNQHFSQIVHMFFRKTPTDDLVISLINQLYQSKIVDLEQKFIFLTNKKVLFF